jgi:DHA1 family inner membrane transport protein
MPIAIYALALAAFAVGSAEFVISGILPPLAEDLAVSIPIAGLLVSAYAIGVAIGGPALTIFTSRFSQRNVLICLMIVFAIAQVLCAIAPDYGLLLAARLLSACAHGVFFGAGNVVVVALVPPERRGAAFSLFISGITIANLLGLPGGSAIGLHFGWRVPFLAVAALGALAAIVLFLKLPDTRVAGERHATFREQVRELRHQEVWLSYLTIALVMIGALAFGTFQVPILLEITKLDANLVPIYLLLGGAGAVVGIFAGGRLADWKLMPSLITVFFLNAVGLTITLLVMDNPIAMAVMMVINGAFGFIFSTPVQVRILKAASAAPNLASTLISTAYNTGIALGAVAGAVILNLGFGYTALPIVGIACSTISGLIALLSWTAERRTLVTA